MCLHRAAWALAALGALASPAAADDEQPTPPAPTEPAAPANYVGVFVGTSLAYRPPGGPVDVAPGDLNLNVGYGRAVTPALSLELDAGVTLIDGKYASFSFTPSAVYVFAPYAYAAMRVIIPVDPEVNVGLAPGLGLLHAFGDNVVILELNAISFVGKGDPDFALSLTGGLLRFF